MEIVIALFFLVGGSLAFSAWKNKKSSDASQSVGKDGDLENACCVRTCLACGHEGEMKTWIANYTVPKLIAIAGFLLGYIPGLIFLGVYWGKFKCPQCGKVGKTCLTWYAFALPLSFCMFTLGSPTHGVLYTG